MSTFSCAAAVEAVRAGCPERLALPNHRHAVWVQVRIWARKEAITDGYADFALNITGPIFSFLEDLFNISYPLPKTGEVFPRRAAGLLWWGRECWVEVLGSPMGSPVVAMWLPHWNWTPGRSLLDHASSAIHQKFVESGIERKMCFDDHDHFRFVVLFLFNIFYF